MEKNPSPDPPFISHYAIIQGEMGLFLTSSFFELQRCYCQNHNSTTTQPQDNPKTSFNQHQSLSGEILPHFDINNISVAQKLKKLKIGQIHLEL